MSSPAIASPGSVQRDVGTKQPSQQDIEKLAYAIWQERGSPHGSAEQDWFEAERQLRSGVEGSLSSEP